MKTGFHDTLIGSISKYVNAWRKREGWSRESVVDVIVQAHIAAGADKCTGIEFSSASDIINRQLVNAQKVYRWLDDESKDNNLLPANFIPSILAALPADLRLRLLDEILSPLGVQVAIKENACATVVNFAPFLMDNQKESMEAQQSLVALMDGEATDEELDRACAELLDQENAAKRTREVAEAERRRRALVKGVNHG